MKSRILALITLLSTWTWQPTAVAQSDMHFTPSAAVRSLQDDSGSATPTFSTPAAKSRNVSLASSSGQDVDLSVIAPSAQNYTPYDLSSQSIGGCAQCTSDCGSGGLGCGRYGCAIPSCGWLSAETLLFFAADRQSPPLVMTAQDGVNPLDGQVAFGQTFESGVLPGFRVSAGRYLGSCGRLGVGARAYGIFDDRNDYSITSDGSTSVGVPFYNPLLTPNAGTDAFIVAGNLPNSDPISTGSLQAGERLSMIGAEASGYVLLSRTACHRFDMVAGYTYNQLRNSVFQNFVSTNLFDGDGIVDGTVFQYNDRFATENQFNGAHLGVLSSVVRKRVNLSTLAKVSFGNMRTRTQISGSGSTTVPGNPPDVDQHAGFFARASNIGNQEDNRFAFIPELGIKLGYCVRPNVQLSVGYTLLMWSSVGLAGQQIDPVVDTLDQTGYPRQLNQLSAYWMQSVDLGLTWSY
ncbi:MAG: BBP7 family outer membrane beta-barrel protein [Pirellulaceae bacterium]|nr:BBP7 family outer membrane beta-barrel protein [Pirellulaceae bacterium]